MSTPTRARIQLQTGHDDLQSVTNQRVGLTWLEVAMMVRTLHANTAEMFDRAGQRAYQRAVEKVCSDLERAMRSRFQGGTAGNKFRDTFSARMGGKRLTFRVDVELAGPPPAPM